ncbi:MAG: hypothetical protein RL235_1032, partial [Chlamydiota bacterium]
MTLQAHPPLRRIFARFFPRKYVLAQTEHAPVSDALSDEEKKETALRLTAQAELALMQGNLAALSLFESAVRLDPMNPSIWLRQGLAFFEYGSEESKEKALLLANKYFKHATRLDPTLFEAWVGWGNTLLQLGRFHEESHFHLEAKEKYQRAIALSSNQQASVLYELYWDYGTACAEMAGHSGEALDQALAIEAFGKAIALELKPAPELLNQLAEAYLDMGLLVNDEIHFFNATRLIERSVQNEPRYIDGWMTLAEVHAQLYLNTLDEKHIAKASQGYSEAVKLAPKDPEGWLAWAQILAESGRINEDPRMLHQSVEKCARASMLGDPNNPEIVAQWVESLSHLGVFTHRLDLLNEAQVKVEQATEEHPDDPDLWHAHGICLGALAKYYEEPDLYEQAIDKMQTGLSYDRTSAEHWHSLALLHAEYAHLTDSLDLWQRANRFFTKAIELKPACPPLIFDAAHAHFMFSEAASDLPALEQSIYLFETLLSQYRSVVLHHPEWLYGYASALDWLGEYTGEERHVLRAIELFSHVLLIEPDFAGIHHKMGRSYVQLGHLTNEPEFYRRGIGSFRLALRNNEENDGALLDWGICLIDLA